MRFLQLVPCLMLSMPTLLARITKETDRYEQTYIQKAHVGSRWLRFLILAGAIRSRDLFFWSLRRCYALVVPSRDHVSVG